MSARPGTQNGDRSLSLVTFDSLSQVPGPDRKTAADGETDLKSPPPLDGRTEEWSPPFFSGWTMHQESDYDGKSEKWDLHNPVGVEGLLKFD